MPNKIEGKTVDPKLLTIVENPHIVPARMLPFQKGPGSKDIEGYAVGHISQFESVFIASRIRQLVANILNSTLGKNPVWAGKTIKGRVLDALGKKLTVSLGIKSNPGLLVGECQVDIDSGPDVLSDRIAIAEEGYTFTDKLIETRQSPPNTHITMDTEGQWIKRFLGDEAEGKRMVAMSQEADRKIVLAEDKEDVKPQLLDGFYSYTDEFIEVADITGERIPDYYTFAEAMAVVLRVHNTLYAVHKTHLDDAMLPGGTFSDWEI
ncbi:hypothetical protein HOF67_02010 [Candidatus Peregrinibacteria bacterium]|jgi:hypothetical protein|nr:hypothetical protein [Candidatus Peregrinibacteria bacterium]